MVSISSLCAGLLALLFLFLSLRVILARSALRVGFGDGQSDILLRRIRVHGNFAEYVPFVLLLMAFIEWRGGPKTILHSIGMLLLLGRGFHAYGLSKHPELPGFRVMASVTAPDRRRRDRLRTADGNNRPGNSDSHPAAVRLVKP